MKLYLLESYPPNLEFNKDSTVIALTPEACYQMDKADVKYSIPEDYYSQHDLQPSKEYQDALNQWIARIDKVLYEYVEEVQQYNLKLAEIYSFYFQYRVLDQLFARCYMVNKMLEALKPSKVIFATQDSSSTVLNDTFQSTGQSYYHQIVLSICKQRSLPIEYISSNKRGKQHSVIAFNPGQSAILKNMFFEYKYLTSYTQKQANHKLNIFLPKTVHMGFDFIAHAVKCGHNVYGLNSAVYDIPYVTSYTHLGIRKYTELHVLPKVFENTNKILGQSELCIWFNELFQADVSKIILPRLRFFILDICPLVIAYYKVFIQFYKQANITTLIMPHDTSPHETAALLAANDLALNTVCIVHGDNVCDVRGWGEREVKNYKTIIISNSERKPYYEQLGAKKVYVSPHRLSPQLKLKRSPRQGTVTYIASLTSADSRGLDGGTYPDVFLYKLEKAIVEYMSTRTDYSFVFKGLPDTDLLYNPIPDFIADSKFSNIQYSAKPFMHHLKHTDRVICDVPSTGFYESVVAGVSTLALYHTSWVCRQSALDYFGQLVKPFSTITEAIALIDTFLNTNSDKYIMKLGTSDNSILDILENKCQ